MATMKIKIVEVGGKESHFVLLVCVFVLIMVETSDQWNKLGQSVNCFKLQRWKNRSKFRVLRFLWKRALLPSLKLSSASLYNQKSNSRSSRRREMHLNSRFWTFGSDFPRKWRNICPVVVFLQTNFGFLTNHFWSFLCQWKAMLPRAQITMMFHLRLNFLKLVGGGLSYVNLA